MKITNYKIKFFAPMIVLTMMFSCKKENVEQFTPKTVVDFEKSMATDKDFIIFNEASLKMMNNIDETYLGKLANGYKPTPRRIYSTSEVNASVASIKTMDDLLVLYKKLNIPNPEKMVEAAKEQIHAYQRFIQNNPDFGKLTVKERQQAISKTMTAYQIANTPLSTILAKRRQIGTLVAEPDPLYAYNLAIWACDTNYQNAVAAIWAAADISMLASALAGGAAMPFIFMGATVATGYARNNHYNCYDLASANFFNVIS